MKRIIGLFLSLIITASWAVGELPAGSIGTVNQTATGTYQLFSYTFTATTSGANYVGLAFRQDPGYWSVGSLSLTAGGNSTNLLNNGNLQYGGTSSVGLQAPADWGVWYQSGSVPAAAGYWYAPGSGWMGSTTAGLGVNTSTSGSWIDGAVGSYDGIYQGFTAVAGTTYTFSFYSSGTNPYSNPSIMIGVYAGACASGTSVFTCTPVSSALTASATPQQTQGTGGAPPPASGPTVVSTQNTTIITTSTSGSTTNTYSQPVTITTYSDGSTTTTNNGSATLIGSATTGGGGITGIQQTQVTNVQTRQASIPTSSSIYIQQSGWGDTYNITQIGRGNAIDGSTYNTATGVTGYQTYAQFSGGANQVTIRQGDPASAAGKNIMDLSVAGAANYLNLNQGTDANGLYTGTDTGNHYLYAWISGGNNNITTVQEGTGATGQFEAMIINGSSNTINTSQTGSQSNQTFLNVTGSYNSITTSQSGSSPHYLSISSTGNNNSATVTQSNTGASGANNANITLINAGAPASINLTQTGGQSYGITQTCYTSACGTITLRQGN